MATLLKYLQKWPQSFTSILPGTTEDCVVHLDGKTAGPASVFCDTVETALWNDGHLSLVTSRCAVLPRVDGLYSVHSTVEIATPNSLCRPLSIFQLDSFLSSHQQPLFTFNCLFYAQPDHSFRQFKSVQRSIILFFACSRVVTPFMAIPQVTVFFGFFPWLRRSVFPLGARVVWSLLAVSNRCLGGWRHQRERSHRSTLLGVRRVGVHE